MRDRAWNIRRTPEREALVEKLRLRLKTSGREVDIIDGAVPTASIFDEALKELDKALEDKQLSKQR